MFTVDYNSLNPEANILVKQQDIFQNTLTIKSVHCYYGTVQYHEVSNEVEVDGETNYVHSMECDNGATCCSPHRNIPTDIVYKSTPQGENIYITLGGYSTSNRLIFNINGKTNIELFKKDDMSDDYGNRLYFEITKEQLKKMCSATSLAIQTSSSSGEVLFEGNASGFITILQALYNEAIDNTIYTNAKVHALAILEDEVSHIQNINNIEISKKTDFDNKVKNTNTTLIVIAAFMIVSCLILLLSTCSR